ncbi:hypothetical protein B0H19DRAFT_168925 [Mycena capillaripes]|nr:hypothetical protein B0H19DRAFT_168925 [Mycena capillaripes]
MVFFLQKYQRRGRIHRISRSLMKSRRKNSNTLWDPRRPPWQRIRRHGHGESGGTGRNSLPRAQLITRLRYHRRKRMELLLHYEKGWPFKYFRFTLTSLFILL